MFEKRPGQEEEKKEDGAEIPFVVWLTGMLHCTQHNFFSPSLLFIVPTTEISDTLSFAFERANKLACFQQEALVAARLSHYSRRMVHAVPTKTVNQQLSIPLVGQKLHMFCG